MSVRRRTVLAAAAAAVAVTAASPGLIAATSPPADTVGRGRHDLVPHPLGDRRRSSCSRTAASAYSEANPNVTVEIQAVPFGDLLTTIRAQAGGDAPTISGIYDLWLPELVRDELVVPAPEAVATEVTDELAGRCGHRRHGRRRAVRRAQRDRPLRPQLQHRAVRGGRHRGAAGDLGRADRRRRGAHRARRRHDHPAGPRADQLVGGRRRPPVRLAARLQRRRADRRGRDAGAEHARGAGDVRAVREPRVRRAGHRPDDGHGRRQHHRPVPRQLRRRQHGDDHHGQLVGVGAAHRAWATRSSPTSPPPRSPSGRAASRRRASPTRG